MSPAATVQFTGRLLRGKESCEEATSVAVLNLLVLCSKPMLVMSAFGEEMDKEVVRLGFPFTTEPVIRKPPHRTHWKLANFAKYVPSRSYMMLTANICGRVVQPVA